MASMTNVLRAQQQGPGLVATSNPQEQSSHSTAPALSDTTAAIDIVIALGVLFVILWGIRFAERKMKK